MTIAPLNAVFSGRENAAGTRALVMPSADFWLTGGASLAVLAVFWVLTDGVFKFKLAQMPLWAYYAAFAVNYPHFLYSYQLFYPNFLKRLAARETTLASRCRLAVAGLLVPSVMLAYFVFAWWTQNRWYLGVAAFAMVFSVGWHYVKQAYGVLITMSLYKNVFYSVWEKRVLYINAYIVWIFTWIRTNHDSKFLSYYDVGYKTFTYPAWLLPDSLLLAQISTAVAVAVLFYKRKNIPFAAVVGYLVAIYLWVVWPYSNMAFYVFVPLFHSLQYLPFLYKFKKSEFMEQQRMLAGKEKPNERRRAKFRIAAFVLGGFVLGLLFFNLIPEYLDHNFRTSNLDPQFFLMAFIIFINIHHFFIDNAFWRRDNADVQKYLFKA